MLIKTEKIKEAEKDNAFHKLAGIWANDPDIDRIEKSVLTGRRSNKTRNLIPFDE